MGISEEEYNRKFGASPLRTVSNTATIAANAFFNLNFDRDNKTYSDMAKYVPLDYLHIRHGSTAGSDTRIKIYKNGDMGNPISIISPGEVRDFDKSVLPGGFETIQIQNIGATTIAIGELEVIVQKMAVEPIDDYREIRDRIKKG